MGIHDGHRQRMRERFLKTGLNGFDDLAILEFLLFYGIPRRDTNPIAHDLLNRFGSLANVLDAPLEELLKVEHVTRNAATLLRLIPEVGRRYMVERTAIHEVLDSTAKCGDYLVPRFFGERDEVVWLACLDAKLMVLDCRLLFRGTVTMAAISIRKIVETALACNASSVVMAHNHVGGFALPSVEDERATEKIRAALDAVNIELIDHIIVSGDDYVSMRDSGFFRKYGEF